MIMTETAIFWIDGDRFVFKGDEVDEALRRACDADSIPEAWEATAEYGRELDQE